MTSTIASNPNSAVSTRNLAVFVCIVCALLGALAVGRGSTAHVEPPSGAILRSHHISGAPAEHTAAGSAAEIAPAAEGSTPSSTELVGQPPWSYSLRDQQLRRAKRAAAQRPRRGATALRFWPNNPTM